MTADIPETNKTSLGLYASPREAHEMWNADPGNIYILDVRGIARCVAGLVLLDGPSIRGRRSVF